MSRQYTFLILCSSIVFMAACSSDDVPTDNLSTIDWASCDDVVDLQCGSLEVPMNYNEPDGENITLALIRRPADSGGSAQSLLFNPGGPGDSGVAVLKALNQLDTVPDQILDSYHLVGFDPRGIGESTPVDCSEFGLDDINEYPRTDSAIAALHDQYTLFAARCEEKYAGYLQTLGSMNVMRDMEAIRQALGDDKLNFIGYSYGTRLAALYLQHYSGHSGRLVLDGSVHPESSVDRLVREALPAKEQALRNLVALCTTYASGCDIDTQFDMLHYRVAELADDNSQAAAVELTLLGEILIAAMTDPAFAVMAGKTIHDYLTSSDVAVLLAFMDQLSQSENDEFLDEGEDEDNDTSQIAVICADDAKRPSVSDLQRQLQEFNQLSDVVAEAEIGKIAMCAGWPASLEPLEFIASDTAPLSLVIGGTSDVQTPLVWSKAMAEAIGGVFIRSEHLGHTSVFNDESDCIDEIVIQFLKDGLRPVNTDCLHSS